MKMVENCMIMNVVIFKNGRSSHNGEIEIMRSARLNTFDGNSTQIAR